MPQRVQMRRVKGWRKPAGAVYCGRPTRWGNPWRIVRNQFGWMCQDTVRNWYPSSEAVARRFAVWRFRRWATANPMAARRLALDELRGKDLACWCRLDQPCHVDVLLELANRSE